MLMNRNTLIALLLVLVVVLVGALVVQAQTSEWTGTKWEYAQLLYMNETKIAMFQQKVIDGDVLTDVASLGKDGLLAVMNYIGELGYDVVHMENINNQAWAVYFKREIPA